MISSNCVEYIDYEYIDNATKIHSKEIEVCVVKISVPIGTKFKSINYKKCIVYDFDKGNVEDVYSYPDISILKDNDISKLNNPVTTSFRFRSSAWGYYGSDKIKLSH